MTKKHIAATAGKAKTYDRPIKLVLADHITAIRQLGKQTVDNIIEIGRRLTECKDNIFGPRGGFNSWIDHEFGWGERHARNFMHVYELAESKSENFSELKLSVSCLYLLAAPSTPEQVRDEIITRAKGGENLKHKTVREAVAKARRPAKTPKASSSAAKAVTKAAEATAPKREAAAQVQQDVGPGSSSQRELTRIDELENLTRVQDLKIIALESEIEDLKARPGALSLQAAIELLIERAHHTSDHLDYALPSNVVFAAEDPDLVVDHLRKLSAQMTKRRNVETPPAPVPAVTAPPPAPAEDGLDIPALLRREVTKH